MGVSAQAPRLPHATKLNHTGIYRLHPITSPLRRMRTTYCTYSLISILCLVVRSVTYYGSGIWMHSSILLVFRRLSGPSPTISVRCVSRVLLVVKLIATPRPGFEA